MNRFIAYFDYLGFKNFIEKNDIEDVIKIMYNNFLEIETSLANEKEHGKTPDISKSKINCTNFSDTIIFWTNDDTLDALRELLIVTHAFNLYSICYVFPVRGAVVYGEIHQQMLQSSNHSGGSYSISSLLGKGIIRAYQKAESQNWAGAVIDESVIQELNKKKIDHENYLKPFCKKYKVPYKKNRLCLFSLKDGMQEEEYVYLIATGTLSKCAFENTKRTIMNNFIDHNKELCKNAEEKFKNTIKFLETFK